MLLDRGKSVVVVLTIALASVSWAPAESAEVKKACKDVGPRLNPEDTEFVGTTIPIIASPWIKGTPKVGKTLLACSGIWNPMPDSSAFVWTAISSSGVKKRVAFNRRTYVVRKADRGSQIVLTVLASAVGYKDTPTDSTPILIQ